MRTHQCKILNNSVKNLMISDRNMIAIFGCKTTDLWGWRDGSIVYSSRGPSSIPNTYLADHNCSPMGSDALFWCANIHADKYPNT